MANKIANQNYYIKHKKKLNELHREYYVRNRVRILEMMKEKYQEKKLLLN